LFVPQENNKEKKDFIRGQERQKSRKKKRPRRLDKKMPIREFAAKRARVGEALTERGSTAWEPEPGRRIKGGTRP